MKKIIMYSSPSCPHCHTAKDFLKKEGIPFIDKNVQNPEIQKEYQTLGVQGVPTFLIDGEVIVGFNPTQLLSKLDFILPKCPSCGKKMIVPKGKGKIRVSCPSCKTKFEMQC